jgi:hypothetical protein
MSERISLLLDEHDHRYGKHERWPQPTCPWCRETETETETETEATDVSH